MNGISAPAGATSNRTQPTIQWLDDKELIRLGREYALLVGAVSFAGALAVSSVLFSIAARAGGYSTSLGFRTIWIQASIGTCVLLGVAALGTYSLHRIFTVSRVGLMDRGVVFQHHHTERVVTWIEFTGRIIGPSFLSSYAIEIATEDESPKRRYEWVGEACMRTIMSRGPSVPWRLSGDRPASTDPTTRETPNNSSEIPRH